MHHFMTEIMIKKALEEDIGYGDITTDSIIDEYAFTEANIISKQEGIIAGMQFAERTFKILDESSFFMSHVKDGEAIKPGLVLGVVKGRTRALLKGERTALNLLQRMSGIATKTKAFCDKVKDFPVKIVDTRKTTPGLRLIEKYAVRVGGGQNHRYSLSEGVLINENHIKVAGSITEAVALARKRVPHMIKIEVETETLEQVVEALAMQVDIIMLNHMHTEQMKKAVEIVGRLSLVEASGNITLHNVAEIAATGVDIISVGSLTQVPTILDISLRIY